MDAIWFFFSDAKNLRIPTPKMTERTQEAPALRWGFDGIWQFTCQSHADGLCGRTFRPRSIRSRPFPSCPLRHSSPQPSGSMPHSFRSSFRYLCRRAYTLLRLLLCSRPCQPGRPCHDNKPFRPLCPSPDSRACPCYLRPSSRSTHIYSNQGRQCPCRK